MKYIKRLLYLGYYFKNMDWQKLRLFVSHVASITGKSKIRLWWGMLGASIKYNISPLEYFQFHYYSPTLAGDYGYAGTGYMYEYQLKMNPKNKRKVLEDKSLFLKRYSTFVKHLYATLDDLKKDNSKADAILNNPSGKIVLKSINGQCGRGIEVVETKEFNTEKLIKRLQATGNNLVEEYVVQHDDLNKLSPSGLNTLRIITQLDKNDEVKILGIRLRITVNSAVDNLAAGNIAAPVDEETGVVNGKGVYSDITKEPVDAHPVTGVKILGFKLPYFKESVQLAIAAALADTSNRSIGWDIAITNQGPELIEGNHDWCKLLWQLPVQKGLNPILEKYKKELLA